MNRRRPIGTPLFLHLLRGFRFSPLPAKMPGMNKTVISRLIVAAILPVFLFGCLSTSLPPAPPVSAGQLAAIRDEYRRANPEARVGLVTAVLPSTTSPRSEVSR